MGLLEQKLWRCLNNIQGEHRKMVDHNHLIAAKLCRHSYYNLTHEDKGTDVQFYVSDLHGYRFIAFPGTFSLRDWLTNFKFFQLISPYEEDYKGRVKLHCGYYNGYISVQEKLLEAADKNLDLIITGHSAGGAIAQIAAVDVNYRLFKNVEAVTFGSPGCGNKAWKNSASKRIDNTSYANFLDPVPFIIPFYHHVSSLITNSRLYLNPHNIKNYIDAAKTLE